MHSQNAAKSAALPSLLASLSAILHAKKGCPALRQPFVNALIQTDYFTSLKPSLAAYVACRIAESEAKSEGRAALLAAFWECIDFNCQETHLLLWNGMIESAQRVGLLLL